MTIKQRATLSQIANQILNWVAEHKDYVCGHIGLVSNGTLAIGYIDENGREKEITIYEDFKIPQNYDESFTLEYGRYPRSLKRAHSFDTYRGHSTRAPKKKTTVEKLENSVKRMF